MEAFRAGLRDLGYVEGRNITIELRFADGIIERLPGLAAELVALKPALIVAGSNFGVLAARQATSVNPIARSGLNLPVADSAPTANNHGMAGRGMPTCSTKTAPNTKGKP